MNDDRDPLSLLLKTWRHTPRETADFNRRVWARVQSGENPGVLRGFFNVLALFPAGSAQRLMPLAACLLLFISLALGSGAAIAYESLNRDQRMAELYARSIDPLQMSAAAPHGHS